MDGLSFHYKPFSFFLWFMKPLQFGDHDGIGNEVLLQHPLGVMCAKDGQVYIADSYNHKVIDHGLRCYRSYIY